MKSALIATAMVAALTANAAAEEIKMGLILGFTGPIESLTPGMADGAELAWKEASDSGLLLDGSTIVSVRADSTCIDAAAATTAAERLITADKVVAIMGADCSGVTTAIANNAAVPNGVVMVSPSATSPALSTIDDKGHFFRTAPSDARQGEVLADVVMGKGIKEVAVTYTNNDYGKGLAESFAGAYEKVGGKISISAAHEDGKADYSAEVAALDAAGGDALVVLGYLDQGGKGIIQGAIDAGSYEQFVLADGMIGQSLIDAIGEDLEGTIGTLPGSESDNATNFLTYASSAGVDADGPFRPESYDAGALLALAMQAAGSTDRAAVQAAMIDVANAPGVQIHAGQLDYGLFLLKNGVGIDYVGATNVEFLENGDIPGSYKELVVQGGKFETVTVR